MYSTDREKAFKRKRLLSLIIGGGYSFVGGVEYIVIVPTAWNYLQSLGETQECYLGFTISAYSLSAAIAGIVGGRLADIYVSHTKMLVMLSIALRAFGNFQYLLGISVWNILLSRCVCGIGTAAGIAILAEICRTTTVAERTPILSLNNAMFDMGILVGPAFQLLLSYFNFSLFGLMQVNPLNAPGLFMGGFWLLYWVATGFFYYNLADEFRRIERLRQGSALSNRVKGDGDSGTKEQISFTSGRFGASIESNESASEKAELLQTSEPLPATYLQYKEEFLKDTFVVILSMLFTVLFSVAGIEAVLPVITQDRFGFGVIENSLILMVGGVEAVLFFFALGHISKCVRQSTLQVLGWFLLLFSQIWLMVVIPTVERGNVVHIAMFLFGIFILYLGNPVAYISSSCLLSKVLSNETQGLGQGLQRVALYLGLIYGPAWAGSTVTNSYLFLGVSVAILVLDGIMLVISFGNMRREEIAVEEQEKRNKLLEEVTPLLVSSGA